MISRRQKRAMQAENIGLGEQLFKRRITRARIQQILCRWPGIVRQQSHAETGHDFAEHTSNDSCAYNSKRLAMQIKTQQTVKRKITVPGSCISAMQLAIKCQD